MSIIHDQILQVIQCDRLISRLSMLENKLAGLCVILTFLFQWFSSHFKILITFEYELSAWLLSLCNNIIQSWINRCLVMSSSKIGSSSFCHPRQILLWRDHKILQRTISLRKYSILIAMAWSGSSPIILGLKVGIKWSTSIEMMIDKLIFEYSCS